jgi:citrate synthase
VLRARLARGESIPGFGHRLYEHGDPRATALLALAEDVGPKSAARARLASVVAAMKRARQPGPNLDAGLVGLCQTLGLPEGASAALFAVGRVAGWVAHALEQRAQGYLLRPRSLYTGPVHAED